ncbi:MAG: OmpA family protein [Cyclobacteriaceae bacterium]
MRKKRVLLFFAVLLLTTFNDIVAQDQSNEELAQEYINQAELIMEATAAMVDARDLYVLAAEADPSNIKANWMAGDFHLRTIGKDRAVKYFLKVLELDPNYRFDIMYQIGRSYQYGMDFDNALAYYTRYLNKLKQEDGYRGVDKVELPEVTRRIYECNNAKEFVANPAHYSIVNVGNAINSEFEEYAPVLNEDETLIIFTTRRRDGNLNENVFKDNKPFEDIFMATKENGVWSPAMNIGNTVNTEYHDSNLALSADGEQLFIYKDENNGDIYVSNRDENGTWSYPEPLSENINSEGFKESSISISPDGTILFFASDRPGGFGGTDIYYSVKDARGEWGRSKNLGAMINTEYDDDGPFIDYDGKTLYFSSRGRKGMGGYDIFRSEYDSANNDWKEPENLGFPINTPDDDIYFVSTKDGKRGYYASVREDGLGYTDIYMVTILSDEERDALARRNAEQDSIDEVEADLEVAVNAEATVEEEMEEMEEIIPVTITVTILDENGEPVDAQLSITSVPDNMVAGKSREGVGEYRFTVSQQTPKRYNLSVEKDGYLFEDINLGTLAASSEASTLERTVRLRKLELGTSKILRNIYFEFDKATFRDESYSELNKLETMMAQNPGMVIEIAGHTDNIGTKAYNLDLSQRRANAVKDFLVNKGIDARRINAHGYGEERPLASNDDEREGREINRRVEFKVTGGK